MSSARGAAVVDLDFCALGRVLPPDMGRTARGAEEEAEAEGAAVAVAVAVALFLPALSCDAPLSRDTDLVMDAAKRDFLTACA